MPKELHEDRSDIPFGANVVEYEPGLFIVGGRHFYYREGWVIDPKNNNRNHIESIYGKKHDVRDAVWDLFELRDCRDCVNCVSCSYCERCTDCSDCHHCVDCNNSALLRNCTGCVNCATSDHCDDCTGCIWVSQKVSTSNVLGTHTIGYARGSHHKMRKQMEASQFPWSRS